MENKKNKKVVKQIISYWSWWGEGGCLKLTHLIMQVGRKGVGVMA